MGIYLNGEVDHLQENSIERGRYKGHRKVMKSGELDCFSQNSMSNISCKKKVLTGVY